MQQKVLIIGAGPAGLCLSLALAQRGMQVELFDRQPLEALAEPAFDGREIALAHASMRLLRELGVWRHVPADAPAMLTRAKVMDGANEGFEVSAASLRAAHLGAFVSNHHIRAAAWKAVAEVEDIHVHTGTAVDSVRTDHDRAQVTLADGRQLEGALLVAADSRFSRTRQAMGIATHMHDFGLAMLLCRIRHDESLGGTAWEWFGQHQTRALLPLGEGLSSAILTLPVAAAETLRQLDDAALAAELESRFEGRLHGVQIASSRHLYPLVATWARRFVGTRFALVGDAAVGMHPVTAHGFNLGLTSIEHLARAVRDGLAHGNDPGQDLMLARYQRHHRISAAPLFAGTQLVAGLFTDPRPHARPLRRAIMQVGRHLPPLRRALAAGLTDEAVHAPSLAQHARLALRVLKPRLGTRHAPT